MITFFDVEASSLGPDSYPIEVGWASLTPNDKIVTGAILIKPDADWTDWSPAAENVHLITRQTLDRHGRSPSYAARALNERFIGETVYSDAQEFDARWIDRLYQDVGIARNWQIDDADAAFGSVMRPQDSMWLSVALEDSGFTGRTRTPRFWQKPMLSCGDARVANHRSLRPFEIGKVGARAWAIWYRLTKPADETAKPFGASAGQIGNADGQLYFG